MRKAIKRLKKTKLAYYSCFHPAQVQFALRLLTFALESAAIEAGRVMLKRLHDLAAQRKSFAFETTLATRSYAKWLKALLEQGYDVHLIYLWLRSPEIAIARVQERVRAGGHDVPEETIRRRYKRGVENFFVLYESLATSWSVYDHSMTNAPHCLAMKEGSAAPVILAVDLWRQFCEVAK